MSVGPGVFSDRMGAMYGKGAKLGLSKKNQHSMFSCYLLSSYELWNYFLLVGNK